MILFMKTNSKKSKTPKSINNENNVRNGSIIEKNVKNKNCYRLDVIESNSKKTVSDTKMVDLNTNQRCDSVENTQLHYEHLIID